MALSSTWFDGTAGTNYEDVEVAPDFSSASVAVTSIVSGGTTYWRYRISGFGRACCMGGAHSDDNQERYGNTEYGYFYATSGGGIYGNFLHVHLDTASTDYRKNGEPAYWTHDDAAVIETLAAGGSVTNTRLYMWMPETYYGTVAEVAAAALLNNGVDDSEFDVDSWSDSDDGQRAYGTSRTINVLYRREPGQTYVEMLKALVRHSWDLLTINMAGKIALYSRSNIGASETISGLDRTDGAISVQWRYAYEHLCNSCYAGYGRWWNKTRQERDEDGGGSTYFQMLAISEVAVPSEYQGNGGPWVQYTDASNYASFGRRDVYNSRATYYSAMKEESRRAFHLPYLTQDSPTLTCADAEQALDDYMERQEADAELRREITVVQDLRGLDYDVGYKITDVALTRDGETISDMRCIKKTIDLNDFTVTSVLLEEPS